MTKILDLRPLLRLLAVIAVLAASLVALAPPSSANPILPTKTVLTTDATPAVAGGDVHLTATVSVLNVGLRPVTPHGTVTFTLTPYVGPDVQVTAPLGSCKIFPRRCTAVATAHMTGDLAYGASVTAHYNGDAVAKPSAAQLYQSTVSPADCNADQACVGGAYSDNGNTSFYVFVDDQGVDADYQIQVGFSPLPLSCTKKGTGDTAVWDVTYPAPKQAEYTTYGAAAIKAKYTPTRICYSSDLPFTTKYGAQAKKVSLSPVRYEGLLPLCKVDSPGPCVSGADFYPAGGDCEGGCQAQLTTYIKAPAGDPKTTH